MIAYAFFKIRSNPDPNNKISTQYGDFISIHKIRPISSTELRFFIPIKMDFTIPCGVNFENGHDCTTCKDNDPLACDVHRFSRPEWSDGELFEEPTMINKHRYKIDLKTEIDPTILAIAEKEEKTAKDESDLIAIISAINLNKTIILDKSVV